MKRNSHENKEICVIINENIDKELRLFQAKWISKNKGSCSYSKAINLVLRPYF